MAIAVRETLTLLILVVFKKIVLFQNFFGQLLSEEIADNDELQENVVYIGLGNIESNGVSPVHLRRKRESFGP